MRKTILSLALAAVLMISAVPSQAKPFSGTERVNDANGCLVTTTWSWWGMVSETTIDCSMVGSRGGFVSEQI